MSKKVISIYFSTETGMDSSLSEFQEKKKYNTGPKIVSKTRNNKKPKSTKGQKDIRALIKKQENDLLSYSKDFDKVCKDEGVDIDSEELQIAIALSKSLYEVRNDGSSDIKTQSTVQFSSKQRTLKIKTTLQEYGFRVPKTKKTWTTRRKRCNKPYKLLLISETERQQIITDKYSEVLAGNNFKSPCKVLDCDFSDNDIYYKTTNISYGEIKNDDLYYVKELFAKPGHKNCLLRDWSEIPGRPLSPSVRVNNIKFENIKCNQHELDCILSGTLSAAQKIITHKSTSDIAHDNGITTDKALKDEVGGINNIVSGIILTKENITSKNNNKTNSNIMSVSQIRCMSPDLFDDEVSSIMECPENEMPHSEPILSRSDNINTYCMDLTECVNIDFYGSSLHGKTKMQTTNEKNVTKRRSNDLMELTECVYTTTKQQNIENIDLTQSSNDSNDQSQDENIEIMDLTQVSNYNPLAEEVRYKKRDNTLDGTISVINSDSNSKQQPEFFLSEELPKLIYTDDLKNDDGDSSCENGKEKSFRSSSDKTYNSNCERHSLKNLEVVEVEQENEVVESHPNQLNLTSSSLSQGKALRNQPHLNYLATLGKKGNISIDYDEINDNIDCVSVTSLSSDEYHRFESNSIENETNQSNRDISLNYSLYQPKHDNFDIRCTTVNNNEDCSQDKDVYSTNNDIASNPSKSSEIFKISDQEFNYSLHQTCNFRDVTLKNDYLNYETNSVNENIHYSTTKNKSLSESNLQRENIISPLKELSQSQKLNLNTEIPNLIQSENIRNILNTPKTSEYIIKTHEVTPMLDYASMTSPERKKELEKYGLKPFKRKRAVQLLTYLYNQTHPIVESHEDDYLSPSKRQKKNIGDENCSVKSDFNSKPLDYISKITKSPIKFTDSIPGVSKETDLYAVTNEQPEIRNIEIDVEDWFFQKRERAKLHSCRVPLHIAFHNYVSCRRRLREAILRYEPVNIDVIHKDLVRTGFRYNPKDLMKFMDRKCITVKTADNNSRNRKS